MDPFRPYRVPEAADAATVALQAVAHIAGDEALLARFLALSGCDLDTLRQRLDDPPLLGAVLEFLLQNEADLLAFCESANLSPTTVMQTRQQLP